METREGAGGGVETRAVDMKPGKPYPLGATWDGLGVNFAVFSQHAERMELCLFDPSGRHQVTRCDLPEFTDQVWHGYLPDTGPGTVYGFRAHGPYHPAEGHRFNPYKLLLDPYARSFAGTLLWSDAVYGYRTHSPRGDASYDRRDSAAFALKAVVTHDNFAWGDDRAPDLPWNETVIYEAHVKGLTYLHPEIPPEQRGKYAALAHPAIITHLRRLGITAIELMPIHAFINDRPLIRRGLTNYWGYNSIGFFTPHAAYGTPNELRGAIRRLHAAGIEVILDVVYNHTAEGPEDGPTLSFRGLDNAGYYLLDPHDKRRCINHTGCGNTLNLAHPRVLQMVMDSLRYWVTSFHVDGFRFDLAPTLGREAHGFDPGAGFFDAVAQDPILSRVKLIAEPWDLGPGGYQVGRHQPGWAEWNDRFRDGLRRYWNHEPGRRPDFAARLAGSGDLFAPGGRRPWASVNYAASHDGFALADLLTYERKHNEANGEGNRDGTDANWSCNWGHEGPTNDPTINTLRDRVRRAMLACVFFAEGTPMLLAGDEFGRTQQGNNNSYCQDNEISWLDWELVGKNQPLIRFVARVTELRRRYPVLRQPRFLNGRNVILPGLLDIEWFGPSGRPLTPDAWNNPAQSALVLRRASAFEDRAVQCATWLLNPAAEDLVFSFPVPALPQRMVLNSADPEMPEHEVERAELMVPARSVILLLSEVSE
jgi:isoamylase